MTYRKRIENLYKIFFKEYVLFIEKELNSPKNSLVINYCEANVYEREETKYSFRFRFQRELISIKDNLFYTLFQDGSVCVDVVLERRLDPHDYDYFMPSKRLLTDEVVDLSFKEIINMVKWTIDFHNEWHVFIDWKSFPYKKVYEDTYKYIENNLKIENDKDQYEKLILLKRLNDMYNKDFDY